MAHFSGAKKLTQFQFDGANRLTNTITPLNRKTTVSFNHQGLPETVKDPKNLATTLFYDAKARLTNRTDAFAGTGYSYDANNNRTNVVENSLTNSWTYDAYNRPSSYRDVYGNLIQYRFDQNGNLTNLVYPGGKNVYYAYDSLNCMTNVTDWAQRKTGITYDLANRVKSITRPNGTYRTMSYDAAGQVTNIIEQMPNTLPIVLWRFNWKLAGTMDWEFAAPLPHPTTVPTRTMTYDDDNRLATFNGSSVVNDDNGNLTSGPLTNDTFFAYAYDSRNRLMNAGGVTNIYDALNNRIAQKVGTNQTVYVVNPNAALSQVLMRIRNGVTNYYVYGLGLLYEADEAGNTKTYHYDIRGSTVAITAGNGQVTDRIEYSAYGLTTYRTGTTDTPFLFNGRYGVQTDPNGVLYMRARHYNPLICRFINPDPSGFSGGLNFYAFANGNPISLIDPFGLAATYWGGVGEVWQGYGLAVVGTVSGLYNVAAHPINTAGGLYNVATHPVQAYNAISASVANTWNSGLQGQGQIVGNVLIAAATAGSGFATATTRASAIAAAEPGLAEGMSTLKLLTTYDQGAQALNGADYLAYGAELTSPLYKGLLMQQGVDLAGDAYSITTSFAERIGMSTTLIGTGLTPGAALVPGVAGAGAEATGWLGNVGLLGNTTPSSSTGK